MPPSIAKGAVEANENIYPFLGLEPYDFSFLPEILDNITPFTFSSLNNYNDPAVESKYAAEKVAPKAIREAFCEIYKTDVLLNFAVEMKAMCSNKNQAKFPNIPEKGNLDLEQVKQSVFFCV